MANSSPAPRRVRANKARSTPIESNGALTTAPSPSVAETVASASSVDGAATPSTQSSTGAKQPAHQAHGAVTILGNGPITNVAQLTRSAQSVSKASMSHYTTMADYTAYLRGLSTSELHRHAVEEAKLVPIDDKERLIKRLQTEWTATARVVVPRSSRFTQEQIDAQNAIRRQLLNR